VYGNECVDPRTIAWCSKWPDSAVRYEHISNQTEGCGLTGTWLRGALACMRDPTIACVVIANQDCVFNPSVKHLVKVAVQSDLLAGPILEETHAYMIPEAQDKRRLRPILEKYPQLSGVVITPKSFPSRPICAPHGSCICASRNFWKQYPALEHMPWRTHPFDANEVVWGLNLKKAQCKGYMVAVRCRVEHAHEATWRHMSGRPAEQLEIVDSFL